MMTNTDKATESLTDLPFEQLKRVLFARLHGEQSFGPITDPRVGLEPFEWLVEQFQRGDTGLRDRMTAVMGEFLNKLADLEAWPAPARSNLLDVLQDCGDTLVDDIRRLIRTRILLNLPGAGAPAHAGLLKCLISLGRKETPEFWMEQFDLLGPEYGALIFSGLLDHGLDVAVRYLPRLCEHEHAFRQVRLLLPVLQDEFGAERVIQAFQSQFKRLPKTTCAVFVADLRADKPEEVAEAEPTPRLSALNRHKGISETSMIMERLKKVFVLEDNLHEDKELRDYHSWETYNQALVERAQAYLDTGLGTPECREIVLGLLLANAQLREVALLAEQITRGSSKNGRETWRTG